MLRTPQSLKVREVLERGRVLREDTKETCTSAGRMVAKERANHGGLYEWIGRLHDSLRSK